MLPRIGRRALAAGLFAMSGCGGQLPARPQTPASAAVQVRSHQASWMLPAARNQDLLYVAAQEDTGAFNVEVFSYPGGKSVGGA